MLKSYPIDFQCGYQLGSIGLKIDFKRTCFHNAMFDVMCNFNF